MRAARPFLHGCVALAIVGSCSSSDARRAVYTPELDRGAIARVTGTWEGAGLAVTICDAPTQSFCAADTCELPCHEYTRAGKDEAFEYETRDQGCDCYECECYYVRSGFAVDVRAVENEDVTTSFYGDALDLRRAGPIDTTSGWELRLYRAGTGRSPTTFAARWRIASAQDGGRDTLRVPPAPDGGLSFDHLLKTKSGAEACP